MAGSTPAATPPPPPPTAPAGITLSATQQATFDLITKDLQETLGGDLIKAKLEKEEVIKCYWGESWCDAEVGSKN